MNLYHVTKFSPYFPFTLHCFYIKISSFILVSTIGIVRDYFHLLIFYSEKFLTWVWRLPLAVNVNLNLSNLCQASLRRPWKLGALSICQNWRAKLFPTQWEFPFYSNLSSHISQILSSMHQGNGYSAKTLGKSVFHYQTDWSGNGPASQFWQMESALGLRVVAWSKPRMFFKESLGKIKFRAFPKRVGPRILSLESVDYFGTSEHYWVVEKK